MIDLKALEKALSVIGAVGKGELSIEIDGTTVVLRVLTADEDIESQQYSRALAEGETEVEGLVLLERYKRSVLSYAIIQIGSLDLRDEEFIATGELTEKGTPVRSPRHLVVRKIVDKWARVTTMALFQKYLELQRRVDAAAEKAIHFDVEDLDAEIGRVEKRLSDLKAEKERAGVLQKNSSPAIAVAAVDKQIHEQTRNMASAAVEQQPVMERKLAPPVMEQKPVVSPVKAEPVRQRIVPVSAPPPPPVVKTVPIEPTPLTSSFEEMSDSMSDSPEALAAETARLIAARNAARNRSMDVASEVIPAPLNRMPPPHREALNTANAVIDSGAGSIQPVRSSSQTDGYNIASGTPILERPRGPQGKPNLNVGNQTGPNNPRFRPGR